MHLHYQSKIQAKKALSKNGKVLGNSIMVGVTHCIDKVLPHRCTCIKSNLSSGPGCSKLRMWLDNVPLNFQKLIFQICQYFC